MFSSVRVYFLAVSLVGITLTFALLPSNLHAQVIHVIRAADTNDGSLKEGIAASVAAIDALDSYLQGNAGLSLDIVDVTGGNFSCSQIMKAVADLQTSEQDVVVFFYLGHGLKAASGVFPEFDCRRFKVPAGTLADSNTSSATLDGVVNALKSKAHRPRLIVVSADSCNRILRAASAHALSAAFADWQSGLSHLFLDYSGTIKLSGSVPGEDAFYYVDGPSKGGLFTSQLLDAISGEIQANSGSAKWEALVNAAIKPIVLPSDTTDAPLCTIPGATAPLRCQHPQANYQISELFNQWPHVQAAALPVTH